MVRLEEDLPLPFFNLPLETDLVVNDRLRSIAVACTGFPSVAGPPTRRAFAPTPAKAQVTIATSPLLALPVKENAS
jgi:hypothetical protein